MDLEDFSSCLRQISHPSRVKIINLLARNPDGVVTTAIANELDMSVGQTCNHLRGMQAAEIVSNVKAGVNSIYYLNRQRVIDTYDYLGDLIYGKKHTSGSTDQTTIDAHLRKGRRG